MQQIEDSYKMLAAAFPDVTQFEVGNELNAPKGHNLCKDGFRDGATAEENAPFIFTTSEQALVTADICYYAESKSRGSWSLYGRYSRNESIFECYI